MYKGDITVNMNEQKHPFDIATKLIREDEVFKGETSAAYANMVGPFGGTIAATLLRAILEHPERQGDPVSITVNYTAPIVDGDFNVKAIPVRTNRSTQHWTMELSQSEGTVITGTAILANRRETWSSTEIEFPSVPSAEESLSLPTEGMPAWVQNYDMRIVRGIPGLAADENSTDSITIQWIKDKPQRPLDFLSLTAICDAFFPRVFVRRNKMVPASTVTLTVYFHADTETIDRHGNETLLGHARAHRFQDGFFDQIGDMWTSDGALLATTHQLVYYRD